MKDHHLDDDDEIEILEVVGIDDDDEAPPAAPEPDGASEHGPEEPRSEPPETVIDLDEEASRPAEVADRESLLRLQADFDNFRKRVEREREDYQRLANAGLLERLLPILDNFQRALEVEGTTEAYDPFRDGISLIHRQLLAELRKSGLRPLDVIGETFDPSLHEAVATEPAVDASPNTVIEELQRGYKFRDRLLRPALVKVAVDVSESAPAVDNDEEP